MSLDFGSGLFFGHLGRLHYLEGTVREQQESLYELARSRLQIVSQEEHLEFAAKAYVGLPLALAPLTLVRHTAIPTAEGEKRWVSILAISINRDFYRIGTDDYTDLIPYGVEHELCEAWLHVKPGPPIDGDSRHLLAALREFYLAAKDGKAEKLLEFYRRKREELSLPNSFSWIDDAYARAVERVARGANNDSD